MTLIIFSTGKITVVGAKREDDIKANINKVMPFLVKHKKKKVINSKK